MALLELALAEHPRLTTSVFILSIVIVLGGIIWACVLASKIEVKAKSERVAQYCLAYLLGPLYVLFYYVS